MPLGNARDGLRKGLGSRVARWYDRPGLRKLLSAAFFFVLFVPALILSARGYYSTSANLSELTYSRRATVAKLAAINVEQNLHRLVDLNASLSSRVNFRRLAAEGRWQEAIDIMREVPGLFDDIDRVFLSDANGRLTADTPSLPGVVGQDFSGRDWYKGVTERQSTYVSEVYVRAAEPRIRVIAVAGPIRDETGAMVGILVMQIEVDHISDWSKSLGDGSEGVIYVVDQYGHAVYHPRFAAQDVIADLSSSPAVRKALDGASGVEALPEPGADGEHVSAFAPVERFGWGVVSSQPADEAFAPMNEELRRFATRNLLYLLLLSVALWMILTVLSAALRYRSAAHRAESEMAAIVENAEDAIIGSDLSGDIVTWNEGAERLYGWTEAEAVGRHVGTLAPEELQGEVDKIIDRIKRGKPVEHYETQRLRKDGTLVDVSLSVSAIRDGTGKVVGTSAVARDVTERKQLDRQKSEFIFIASHQLRTPLTAIKWFLEMLMTGDAGPLDEKQKRFLRNAFESNERMIDLINDLLSVSRIESGTIELVPVETNMNEMIRSVVDETEALAAGRKVSIEYFPADMPRIEVDPKLIRQVLMNLVSNAIKYTQSGGLVRVSCGKEDGFLTFSVSDNGIGVPKDEQPYLFTKFFRATNAAKSEADGTGLGLYVVKRIVELSGGALKFESELGRGSTFTFTLPIEGSPPRRRAAPKKMLS